MTTERSSKSLMSYNPLVEKISDDFERRYGFFPLYTGKTYYEQSEYVFGDTDIPIINKLWDIGDIWATKTMSLNPKNCFMELATGEPEYSEKPKAASRKQKTENQDCGFDMSTLDSFKYRELHKLYNTIGLVVTPDTETSLWKMARGEFDEDLTSYDLKDQASWLYSNMANRTAFKVDLPIDKIEALMDFTLQVLPRYSLHRAEDGEMQSIECKILYFLRNNDFGWIPDSLIPDRVWKEEGLDPPEIEEIDFGGFPGDEEDDY